MLACILGLGPTRPSRRSPPPALAAGATRVLPRIGWLLAAIGLCGWLVSPEADRQGTALVLAAAPRPVPLLLPRAGLLWSRSGARAPARHDRARRRPSSGVAALAPTASRRAGLAAAGFLWLVLAEVLTGRALLFGSPDGTLPRDDWEGSISAAAADAL